MIRVAASLLLLTFAGSTVTPCFATEKSDADGDRSVTISFTNADGVDAISLKGQGSTVIARSLTLSGEGMTIRLMPYPNGVEMRFGSYVIRASELQFPSMPPIKTMDVLKIRTKAFSEPRDRETEQ